MHRNRIFTSTVAMATLAALLSGTPPAAAASAGPARLPGMAITLITGDRVWVNPLPDGHTEIGIAPAAGREHIGFLRTTTGKDTSVIPADALPALEAGMLDERLFNITELRRQRVAERGGVVPVIVTYHPGVSARVQPSTQVAASTLELPSVNGLAIAPGPQFWSWLAAGTAARPLTTGVAKVWLDGIAEPTLDASVPQIGAPTAWQAGYTGDGVTVAVLDTGIKLDHPDLTGKVVESRDFTGTQPGGNDDVGHGTHVAGIIAGTGAASGGKYQGVAPDAKLINGKVCVVYGCADSWIIAAMEWAAPKARVVNMSLGGPPTDGTDPMSVAVDHLTAQHGTLFVIAAGNSGRDSGGVGTPAAADAALAVASVTKWDTMSGFSSRGPRYGDFAVKPDIAGPGSDIVSTRAAGTPVGDINPVDGNYHTLSGTSMAAPHLAGAAAILAEQHAGWGAERLKPALMSTAKPTDGVFDQGAGRVDVARAVTQQVTSVSGSLSFGLFAWPQNRPPTTKTVTYRNDGTEPVTLELTLDITDPDGFPDESGFYSLSADRVTVPAGGTASVDVTADATGRPLGQYSGRLTAAAGTIAVQTAIGGISEPESYHLTVTMTARNGPGTFESGRYAIVEVSTGEAYFKGFNEFGVSHVRLPKGRYDINAFDLSDDGQARTVVNRANVDLTRDNAVTLDATGGRPVEAVVDDPNATRRMVEVGMATIIPDVAGGIISSVNQGDARFYAVPSETTVTDHFFGMFFGAMHSAEPLSNATADVYNLAFWEQGRIPADTRYEAPDRSLARVDTRYHSQGTTTDWSYRGSYARYGRLGPGSYTFLGYEQNPPARRTEFYSADPDITWAQLYLTSTQQALGVETHRAFRSYQRGRHTAGWNRAPLGPAFGNALQSVGPNFQPWGVFRDGGRLSAAVSLFSGSDPGQYTEPASDGVTATTTLSRDGAVIGSSDEPGIGIFDIPDSPGTYTLRATAERDVEWSVIGTKTDISWTFHEPGAGAPAKPLPLTVVRAIGAVDGNGKAPSGTTYLLGLIGQRQPGAPPGHLAELKVEASFDDGATWTRVRTIRLCDVGLATVRHPSGDGFVSLRIHARDRSGNSVSQTMIRAYPIG